jgi:hypothetical protein
MCTPRIAADQELEQAVLIAADVAAGDLVVMRPANDKFDAELCQLLLGLTDAG